jgi:hypothetical protein
LIKEDMEQPVGHFDKEPREYGSREGEIFAVKKLYIFFRRVSTGKHQIGHSFFGAPEEKNMDF